MSNDDYIRSVTNSVRGICNELCHSSVDDCLRKAPDVRFCRNVKTDVQIASDNNVQQYIIEISGPLMKLFRIGGGGRCTTHNLKVAPRVAMW